MPDLLSMIFYSSWKYPEAVRVYSCSLQGILALLFFLCLGPDLPDVTAVFVAGLNACARQAGQREGVGVKYSTIFSQNSGCFMLYLVLDIWYNNFSLKPSNNFKQVSLYNLGNHGTEIREDWEWRSKELMLVSNYLHKLLPWFNVQ